MTVSRDGTGDVHVISVDLTEFSRSSGEITDIDLLAQEMVTRVENVGTNVLMTKERVTLHSWR